MTHVSRFSRPAPIRAMHGAALAMLLIVVFVSDTLTNFEIAAAVFYVVPILLAVRFLERRHVVALAGLCVVLTVVSSVLTQSGAREAGLVNLGISIAAIAVTTYLALRIIATEAAFHEARAQLLRITRITSLGELTASIAHEVNQPLAAVVTSADACRRWLAADPPQVDKARQSVDRIVDDANRASDVIARVRGLSRRAPAQRERMQVNDLVAQCVALADAELERNGVTLDLELDEGLPAVDVDPIQIQQVIGNLMLNAIEAMAETERPDRRLRIASALGRDETVTLSVADHGPGIAEAAQGRLFEAFWTTKEGGTGLGLTISQSIVEAHGGHVGVGDNPGGGALFWITLPIDRRHGQ